MSKHVLVIEDSAIIRKLLRMTLERAGYKVSESYNGLDAIEMALQLRPDLVLLDVMMPGTIDGLEACRRIRQNPALQNTPVLMLSAKGQVTDQKEGLAAGATDYLVKPFEPNNLLQAITRLTEGTDK
jgi:two-component system phosphate regulon response regulator PhoB